MIRRSWAISLLAAVFALAYGAAYELTNWLGVWWLGWWDPAFGTPAESVRASRYFLPLFLGVALASHLAAALPQRTWLRQATLGHVVVVATTAGLLSHATWYAFVAATRSLSLTSPWRGLVEGFSVLWLITGPALVTLAGILVSRRRASVDPIAPAG